MLAVEPFTRNEVLDLGMGAGDMLVWSGPMECLRLFSGKLVQPIPGDRALSEVGVVSRSHGQRERRLRLTVEVGVRTLRFA